MSESLNPVTFDLNAWLADAHLPEASTDVYARPDLIATIQKLQRELALAGEQEGERTAGDKGAATLQDEYVQKMQEFSDSRLTIYVRALPKPRLLELRDENKAQYPDEKVKDNPELARESNLAFGYQLLSASIVAVQPAGGERTHVQWGAEDVKGLESRIGDAQMQKILDARARAQNEAPEVPADFLPGASGTSKPGPRG